MNIFSSQFVQRFVSAFLAVTVLMSSASIPVVVASLGSGASSVSESASSVFSIGNAAESVSGSAVGIKKTVNMCPDTKSIKAILVESAKDLLQKKLAQKKIDDKSKVPEELLKERVKPEFKETSLKKIYSVLEEKFVKKPCLKKQFSADEKKKIESALRLLKTRPLGDNIESVEYGDAIRLEIVVITKQPKSRLVLSLCNDGVLRSADGRVVLPLVWREELNSWFFTDHLKNLQNVSNYPFLRMKAFVESIKGAFPAKKFSLEEFRQLIKKYLANDQLKKLNVNSSGLTLDRLLKSLSVKEVILDGDKLYYVFKDSTSKIPKLGFIRLDQFQLYSSKGVLNSWKSNDFKTINALSPELRDWARQNLAVNVLTKSDIEAAKLLQGVLGIFDTDKGWQERFEKASFLGVQYKANHIKGDEAFNQERARLNLPTIDFTFSPRRGTIRLSAQVQGPSESKASELAVTFRHVGDNIYEYEYVPDPKRSSQILGVCVDKKDANKTLRPPLPKGSRCLKNCPNGQVCNRKIIYRVLITGDRINIKQLAKVFDRISRNEDPQSIVEQVLDANGKATGQEKLLDGKFVYANDFSYEIWKKNLKRNRLKDQLQREKNKKKLEEDFKSRSKAVQLKIRQLALLRTDLLAFRNQILNSKSTRFAAAFRQLVGVGGSESNFRERIKALVDGFIRFYLTPEAGKLKSRLRLLIEEHPDVSLQELLSKVDPAAQKAFEKALETGSGSLEERALAARDKLEGVYIKDTAFFGFIKNVYLGTDFTAKYEAPKSEDELFQQQFQQLMRLNGVFNERFSENYNDAETFFATLSVVPEFFLGKQEYVLAEEKLFEYLHDEFEEVIKKNCRSASRTAEIRAQAKKEVDQLLDQKKAQTAKSVDGKIKKGTVEGTLREVYLREHGVRGMNRLIANLLALKIKKLERDCALRHFLAIKDKNGRVTGGIKNVHKRRLLQLYVHVWDKNGEWLTVSKKNWDLVINEILINTPGLLLTVGLANLTVNGLFRLAGRAAGALGKTIELSAASNRLAGAVAKSLEFAYKSQESAGIVTKALSFVGKSASLGVAEGVFESLFSINLLESALSGKDTGIDFFKVIVSNALNEVIFDISGGISRKIWSKKSAFKNIENDVRFGSARTLAGKALDAFAAKASKLPKVSQKFLREFIENNSQNLISIATMLGINGLQRVGEGKDFSLKGDAYWAEILQVSLQVYSFGKGRKLAADASRRSVVIQSLKNTRLGKFAAGPKGKSAEELLKEVQSDLQGLSKTITSLEVLRTTRPDDASKKRIDKEVNRLKELLPELARQKQSLELTRKSELEKALKGVDENIKNSPDDAQLKTQRADLLKKIRDIKTQRTVVKTQSEYDALLAKLGGEGVVIEKSASRGFVDLSTGRWYVNLEGLKADIKAAGDRVKTLDLTDLVKQVSQRIDQGDPLVLTLIPNLPPAIIPALGKQLTPDLVKQNTDRQQKISAFKADITADPTKLERAETGKFDPEGKEYSFRNFLIRQAEKKVRDENIRHEWGHRLARTLGLANRTFLAQRLGLDLGDPKQREQFEEKLADWVSGDLSARDIDVIDAAFKEILLLRSPGLDEAAVTVELRRIKSIRNAREAFEKGFEVGTGLVFQTNTFIASVLDLRGSFDSFLKTIRQQDSQLADAYQRAFDQGVTKSISTLNGVVDVYVTDSQLALGTGGFEIINGFIVRDGKIKEVVIKRLQKGYEGSRAHFEFELGVNEYLAKNADKIHDSVVPVVGVVRGDNTQDGFIVTEKSTAQELSSREVDVTPHLAFSAMLRALRGFASLSKIGVYHLDINQNNVFSDGSIIDFGVSLVNPNAGADVRLDLQKALEDPELAFLLNIKLSDSPELKVYYFSLDNNGEVRGVRDELASILSFAQFFNTLIGDLNNKSPDWQKDISGSARFILPDLISTFKNLPGEISKLLKGEEADVPTFESLIADFADVVAGLPDASLRPSSSDPNTSPSVYDIQTPIVIGTDVRFPNVDPVLQARMQLYGKESKGRAVVETENILLGELRTLAVLRVSDLSVADKTRLSVFAKDIEAQRTTLDIPITKSPLLEAFIFTLAKTVDLSDIKKGQEPPLDVRLETANDLSKISPFDLLGGKDSKYLSHFRSENAGKEPRILLVDERNPGESLEKLLSDQSLDPNEKVVLRYLSKKGDIVQLTVVVDTIAELRKQSLVIHDYRDGTLGNVFDFHLQRSFGPDGVSIDAISFRETLRGRGFGREVQSNINKIISSKLLNPSQKISANPVNFITARTYFQRFGARLDFDRMFRGFTVFSTAERFMSLGIIPKGSLDKALETDDPIVVKETLISLLRKSAADFGMTPLEYIVFRFDQYSQDIVADQVLEGVLDNPIDIKDRFEKLYSQEFPGVWIVGEVGSKVDLDAVVAREKKKADLIDLLIDLRDLKEEGESAAKISAKESEIAKILVELKADTLKFLDETPSEKPIHKNISEQLEEIENFNKIKASERRNKEKKAYAEVYRPSDVVSIPDVHGDLAALHRSLRHHGLIDINNNWVGGDTVLVMLGDYIDRGPNSLGVLDYLVSLRQQVAAAGGRIELLLGNHEAAMIKTLLGTGSSSWFTNGGLKVIRELKKKYRLKNAEAAIELLRQMVFEKPDGSGVKGRYYELFRSFKVASQVDDVLYVHAGVSLKWAKILETKGIDQLNKDWQQALEDAKKGNFDALSEFSEAGAARTQGSSNTDKKGGLLWNDLDREAAKLSAGETSQVARSLKSLGINAIFVGHSIQTGDLKFVQNFLDQGLLLLGLDVGISKAYLGRRGGELGDGLGGAVIAGHASPKPGTVNTVKNGNEATLDPLSILREAAANKPSSVVVDPIPSSDLPLNPGETKTYRIPVGDFMHVDVGGHVIFIEPGINHTKVFSVAGSVNLGKGQTATVGRSNRSDIQLTDPTVSRNHLKLSVLKSGEIKIEVLTSSKGTTRVLGKTNKVSEPKAEIPKPVVEVPLVLNDADVRKKVSAFVASSKKTMPRKLRKAYIKAAKKRSSTVVQTPVGPREIFITNHVLSDAPVSTILFDGFYIDVMGNVVPLSIKMLRKIVKKNTFDETENALFDHEKNINEELLKRGPLNPVIVPIVAVQRGENKRDGFIAVEKTPADSLESLAESKASTVADLINALNRATTGLASLRAQGISHGDVHEQNIRADGGIIDFGLATVDNRSELNLHHIIVDEKAQLLELTIRDDLRELGDFYLERLPDGSIRGINDGRADLRAFRKMFLGLVNKSSFVNKRKDLQKTNPEAYQLLRNLETKIDSIDQKILDSLTPAKASTADIPTFGELSRDFQKLINALRTSRSVSFIRSFVDDLDWSRFVEVNRSISHLQQDSLLDLLMGSLFEIPLSSELEALQIEQEQLMGQILFQIVSGVIYEGV
jgi:tRNA A-37 threonylcarbamoyl transferase component Bud32